MASRNLFLDTQRQLLVRDLATMEPTTPDAIVEGDTDLQVDIYTDANDTTFASDSVKLAVGPLEDGESKPLGGTFYLIYGEDLPPGYPLVIGKRYIIRVYDSGDSFTNVGAVNASGSVFTATGTTPTAWSLSNVTPVTTDLAFDSTAAQVKAAIDTMLEDLPMNTWSPVTVTGNNGGPWQMVGGDFSSIEQITIESQNLTPQCEGVSTVIQEGDTLNKRPIQRFELRQVPCSLVTSATAITAGAVSLTTITAGVTNTTSAVIDFTLTGSPYAGTVTFKKSGSVSQSRAFNSSSVDIAAAVDSLYGGQGLVTGVSMDSGPVTYRTRLTFAASLGNITGLTVDGSAVTFATGRRFLLDLDTINMVTNLTGYDSRTFRMELQRTTGGTKITTAFSEPVQISSDLIRNAAALPLPAAEYLTATETADLIDTELDARTWGTEIVVSLPANGQLVNINAVPACPVQYIGASVGGVYFSMDGGAATVETISGNPEFSARFASEQPITQLSFNDAEATGIFGVGMNSITELNLTGNNFPVAVVNALLVKFNSFGTSGGTIDLSGGSSDAPTGAGLTAKAALEARGWTVTTN